MSAASATSLRRPANFAALGLSSINEEQPLVEVIKTDRTSADAIDRLVDLVGRIGGKAVVVKDSPGFFVSRVSQRFFNEAMALMGEGVPAGQVEKAAVDSGLASGPLALLDRLSLRLSDELLHQELHELAQGTDVHASHAAAHDHDAPGQRHDHDHDHGHDHDHDHDHGHDHAP